MDTRIGFILNDVVGEPRGGRFGKTYVRHVNGEVLAGANGDVANSTEVHDRLVGLLLDDDRIAGSARIAATDIVHREHPEEVLLALLQLRHGVHVARYRFAVHVRPVVVAFGLLLNDIASDLRAAVASRWSPAQGHRVLGDPVCFRRLGCVGTYCKVNDN